MGVAVQTYEDFKTKFDSFLADGCRLFAVLLFDQSEAQSRWGGYVEDQFVQLDGLAWYARVPFFLCMNAQTNPSLRLAREFGILPSQLPGLMLLTVTASADIDVAPVLVGLSNDLLDDAERRDGLFRDLFERLKVTVESGDQGEALMKRVKADADAIAGAQRRDAIGRALAGPMRTAVNKGWNLVTAMAVAFAGGAGKALGTT
jgi:hypothetical protein